MSLEFSPLSRFRNKLHREFGLATQELFEKLTRESGIDIQANANAIEEIKVLKENASAAKSKKNLWTCLSIILIFVAFVGILIFSGSLYFKYYSWTDIVLIPTISILCICLVLFKTLPAREAAADYSLAAKEQINNLISAEWEHLKSLNNKFSWDITLPQIKKLVPDIHFDECASEERLQDFYNNFDWDGTFGNDCSTLEVQTGTLADFPFILTKQKKWIWGTKTYTGEKHISWTSSYRGPDGKIQTRVNRQTLRASVTKPYPIFTRFTKLIYANPEAPNLTFSRLPSGLTEDTFFGEIKKNRQKKELQKFSRNLTDDSEYTMMTNEDFEVLFQTKNRDNEIEYRLLFTPVAQQNMLELIRDKSVGYGDDFAFTKHKKLNIIEAAQLNQADVNLNPALFWDYDYLKVRKNFLEKNNKFFCNIYSAFLPLLAIPAYQHPRINYNPSEDKMSTPAFWEYEALANSYDGKFFAHSSCETDCILKTREIQRDANHSIIDVLAIGFTYRTHTEYIPVLGGDGRVHKVPVVWHEYAMVKRSRKIEVIEGLTKDELKKLAVQSAFSKKHFSRRNLFSQIL